MKPVIGLYGCGRWGKHILRDLLTLGAEVHVVCLNDTTINEALQRGATSAGLQIPGSIQCDAYVVATPTITHADVLERLAAQTKPVFTEKPITADLESAQRLISKAPEQFFVMHKWRYHPGIDLMRQLKEAGDLGDILAINTQRWQWHSPHSDVSPLWVLAPHDLSIALHILGFIPPVKSAEAVVPGRPDLGIRAVLTEQSGPQLIIDIGIASPEHRRRCLVVGTKGSLELGDAYETELTLRRGAPGDKSAKAETLTISKEMPLYKELTAFVAYVKGEGPPPMSSAREGLMVVERLAEIERLAYKTV